MTDQSDYRTPEKIKSDRDEIEELTKKFLSAGKTIETCQTKTLEDIKLERRKKSKMTTEEVKQNWNIGLN